MSRLHASAWGVDAGESVVCLHGVSSSGRHFAELAARLTGYRVVAPDLLGHGASPHEPPWGIDAHVEAIFDTTGDRSATWIGHSYGGRLALEVAARKPDVVDRLVLLDPAIHLPPHVALYAAESSLADRSYASFDEAIDRRFEESRLHAAPRERVVAELRGHLYEAPDGRWRYRYAQSSVTTAYSEMSSSPPSFERVRVPTLVVLGEHSYLPYDHLLDDHRRALGDDLRVVRVPGGHTVLWDAFDETVAAIVRFLGV